MWTISGLPEKKFWTEWLFGYFPIDKQKLSQQLPARFIFLFAVWITGFMSYTFDGLSTAYISNPTLNQTLGALVTSFIILFGTFHVQSSLKAIIPKLSQILELDKQRFQNFSQRLENYSFSLIPSLLLGLAFVFLWSGVPSVFQLLLTEGIKMHIIWTLLFDIFISFLVGTAFWMFASIWLTIFLVSRQPLAVELSERTNEQFRDLSRLALTFALFYFLSISLSAVITSSPIADPTSLIGLLLSGFLPYIVFGVIGILLPFYSIHVALLKQKNKELNKIRKESENLVQELDEILAKELSNDLINKTIIKQARLISLQAKERRMQASEEWPINVRFLSRLSVLILIPIVTRLSVEIINRLF